jgi:hypothetical protein
VADADTEALAEAMAEVLAPTTGSCEDAGCGDGVGLSHPTAKTIANKAKLDIRRNSVMPRHPWES